MIEKQNFLKHVILVVWGVFFPWDDFLRNVHLSISEKIISGKKYSPDKTKIIIFQNFMFFDHCSTSRLPPKSNPTPITIIHQNAKISNFLKMVHKRVIYYHLRFDFQSTYISTEPRIILYVLRSK